MTTCKRLLTSALLLVLLGAAATVPAGIILVPIGGQFMLDESGETNARQLPDGRIRVDTQGLSMWPCFICAAWSMPEKGSLILAGANGVSRGLHR